MYIYFRARQRAVAAERGAAGDAEPGILRVVPLTPGARRRLRRDVTRVRVWLARQSGSSSRVRERVEMCVG